MKKDIVFDLMHLDKFAIIKEPCTVIIQNNSIVDFNGLYKQDGSNRWILNLKAITEFNLTLIKALVAQNLTLAYRDIGHLLLTGALWEDQVDKPEELPAKGENVIAVFDYVEDILRCTSITLIPRKKAELYSPATELMGQIKEFEQIIQELNE